MICAQLAKCVEQLSAAVKPDVNQGKKAQDKKSNGSVFQGNPCENSENLKNCVLFCDQRSMPSCSEHGKNYTLNIGTHSFETICFHVDGGVIVSNDCSKCDYAFFLKDADNREILIELKGSNVGHALKQLRSTLEMAEFKECSKNRKVYGRISCTQSVPRIYQNEEVITKKLFLQHKGNLKIGKAEFVENYDDLDN